MNKVPAIIGVLLTCLPLAQAADVTMTANDGLGTTSFNTAGKWDSLAAPATGNDYFTAQFSMRTPTGTGSATFQGDSLTVGNGAGAGLIGFKGSGVYTVNDLRLDRGKLANWSAGGDMVGKIAGAINVVSTSTFDGNVSGRYLDIRSTMTGSGGIVITGSTGSNVRYSTNAKNYTGNTVVNANATLRADLANVLPYGSGKGGVSVNGTLNINGKNVTVNGVSGSGTLNNAGTVAATLTVGGGDATSTFDGLITDTGSNLALQKIGTGTFTLTGPNTYVGATTISGGTVAINDETGLGSGPAASTTNQLTLGGGTLRAMSTFPMNDANRGITLNAGGGTIEVDAGEVLTLTNVIYGSVNGNTLTKTGDGEVVMAGANVYKGKTILNAGTFTISAENGLGANPTDAYHQDQVQFDGGTLRVAGTFNIDDGWRGLRAQAGGGTIEVDDGRTLTTKKNCDGAGSMTKTGDGTWATTRVNTFGGGALISAGTVDVQRFNGTTAGSFGTGTITNNATLQYRWALDTGVDGGVANKISGSGTLRYVGTGYDDVLKLTAANDYTGQTILDGGILKIDGNADALGTAAAGTIINVNAGQASINSPTLELRGVTITGEALELNSQNSGNQRTRLRATSGACEWAGPITVKGDGIVQFTVDNGGTTLDLSGDISGSDATTMFLRGGASGTLSGVVTTPNAILAKTDTSIWTITATGHTWAKVNIAKSTVMLGIDNGLATGANLAMGQSGDIATFDMAGYDQQVTGLEVNPGAPSGQIIGNSSASSDSTLTVSGGTSSFAGIIQDTVGAGSQKTLLTVGSGGNLTLGGASTYTGVTTVKNGGTLLVSGSIASDVTAQNGGTYGGGGSCPNLLVQSGGTNAPGASVGTDTVTGNYDLSGVLAIEIDGSGTGSADKVDVTGTMTLTGSTLELTELQPANDVLYIIAEYGSRSGKFATTNGLPDGYNLVYDYGVGGNQIALELGVHEWDGGGSDDSWATGENWLSDSSPGADISDIVIFNDAGSTDVVGGVTSVLDQDRRVGTLIMTNGMGNTHAIDLDGYALKADGDLIVGGSNVGSVVTFDDGSGGGSLTITNGTLVLGYDKGTNVLDVNAAFKLHHPSAVVDIARRDHGGSINDRIYSTLDLSDADSVDITAESIRIATSANLNGPQGQGIVHFSDAGINTVAATTITLGDSPLQGNNGIAASEIHFGGNQNTVIADNIFIARRKIHGTAVIDAGGTLTVAGKSGSGANLYVGYNDAGTGSQIDGVLNMSGGIFNATLDAFVLGRHLSSTGDGQGYFTMDAGSVTANSVTLASTGGSNPLNTIGRITMNGGSFAVVNGVSDGGGTSQIYLNDGSMTITNGLEVDTLTVGHGGAVNATLAAGGPVSIGTGSQTLRVALQDTPSSGEARGTLDLRTASSVAIDVASFLIGDNTANPNCESYGTVYMSTSGVNTVTATTIDIGNCPGAAQTGDWSYFYAGGTTTVDADTVYVGHFKSKGRLAMSAGTTSFTLGSGGDPVGALRVGYNTDTGTDNEGVIDGANGSLVIFASSMELGHHERTGDKAGSGTGRLIMDSSGDSVTAATITLGNTFGRASATATGEINLSGGTLTAQSLVRGDATGTATATLNWTGGTLVVSNISLGTTLVQGGGAMSPGASVGTTVVTGDYSVNGGSWTTELDGSGAGTADQITVSGTLTLGGSSVLDLNILNALDDDAYVLATYGTLSGTFGLIQGLPDGYAVDYAYGVGSDQIALVKVPDPSAGAVYRMKITFENYDKGDVLTNFPVLVVLEEGLNGFSYANTEAGGTDLRFSAADTVTALDYEIESWGSGATPSYVWVRVPELSSSAVIWAYWGSGAAQHALNHANGYVWLANYEAVWHLHSDENDATPNGYDGTKTGTVNTGGRIADGESFDGNDSVSMPTSIVDSEGGSAEAWVRMTSVPTGAGMIFYGTSQDGGNGFGDQDELHIHANNNGNIGYYIRPGVNYNDGGNYADGQWHHVAATWDRSVPRARLYIDGIEVNEDTDSWNSFDMSYSVLLGKPVTNERYFDGELDETRVSGIARSSNWVWATYMTIANNDSLSSYAPATRFEFAAADAYVRGGTYANDNLGTAGDLVLKRQGGNATYWRKVYTRFDVSSVPAGMTVTDARLELSLYSAGKVGQPYTFALYVLDDADPGDGWVETAITWNNAPANNTASGYSLLSNATFLDMVNVPNGRVSGQVVSFESGALAQAVNDDTDGVLTLIVVRLDDRDDAGPSFRSREYTPDVITDQPVLEYTVVATPDDPLFTLQADGSLKGASAPANTLNFGASTVLTNLHTSSTSDKQFSIFRFSREGDLTGKTVTMTVKVAGGTGTAGERPTTFHLWGLTAENEEHWIEGTKLGGVAEGDEVDWAAVAPIAEVYHDYPSGPGSPANNSLLATVTPSSLAVDMVLTFETTELDAFVHASDDAMVSFAITQSGGSGDSRGWDFYSRENAGANAQAAALVGHDPRPASTFMLK